MASRKKRRENAEKKERKAILEARKINQENQNFNDIIVVSNNLSVSDTLLVTESGNLEEVIPLVSIDIKEEDVTGKIVVGYPYSQKAFDLGENIPRHHSTGLIGEFPHKILY
jgi:hypothetical protein